MSTFRQRTDEKYRVVWEPQPGPQTWLLSCPVFELFFGGARGGGKSDGMLGDFASHADEFGEDAIGLIIRRELTQLKELIERSKQIYTPLGAVWHVGDKMWRFPNGARLIFAYIDNDADADKYQGHSYSRVYVEELGNFPSPVPIFKLMACIRSANPKVRCGFRATGNPGGPGHLWIKQRYIMPAPRGMQIIKSKFVNPFTKQEYEIERVFIPSKITDNRYTNNSAYVARLQMVGNARLVDAWLLGNWDIIEGAFFDEWDERKHVIDQFIIPAHWTRFTSMDWGGAHPFSVGWWAVVPDRYDQMPENMPSTFNPRYAYKNNLPRGALVRYREWYGCQIDENGESMHNNTGLKLTIEQIASGIAEREKNEPKNDAGRPRMAYRVAGTDLFQERSGPSLAERMAGDPYYQHWIGASVARTARGDTLGGWDMVRSRLIGQDGDPMIYFFPNCIDSIRTLPALQHDKNRIEDVDSSGEDHCFTGETLVRTLYGVYSFAELVGSEGFTRSHDGKWHPYRSVRLVRRNQRIVRLEFSEGTIIRCTPDHKFLTANGWIKAENLIGMSILSLSPQQSKSLMGQGITSVAAGTIDIRENCFTEQCGKKTVGQSKKDGKSTTKTAIDTITASKIWTVYWNSIISPASMEMNLLSGLGRIWPRVWRQLKRGMQALKVSIGIVSTILCTAPKRCIAGSDKFVSIAVPNMMPITTIYSAPTSANQRGDGHPVSTMKSDLVPSAERNLWSTDIAESKHALLFAAARAVQKPGPVCLTLDDAGWDDVYCLTVPETGNFELANGMIVANCGDEIRYACMSRPYSRPEGDPDKGRIMTVGPDNQLTIKDAMGDMEMPREAKFIPVKRI
jgi:hypothetical protein